MSYETKATLPESEKLENFKHAHFRHSFFNNTIHPKSKQSSGFVNCNCSIAIASSRKRVINVAIVSYQRKHQYENNWQTNKAKAVLAESTTSIPTVYLLLNRVKQDSGRGNVFDNTLLQEILASCLFSDFETQIFSDTLF